MSIVYIFLFHQHLLIFQKNNFQVEYTFYSTLNDPKTRITMKDEKHYNDQGFTRIQESAMCVVGD